MIRTFQFNPFMELTYVVADAQRNAVIIDCGAYTDEEQKRLIAFVEHNELNIIGLLNTHFHLDHQFGNALINRLYGLVPYGSELDRPMISILSQQCEWFGIQPMADILTDLHAVSDGQEIQFGDLHFRVISTPGHTPGGVCYLMRQDSEPDILFSGDTLFCRGMGRTDLPYGNYDALIDSIFNRLFLLPDNTIVYPGHGPKTTIGAEKQLYHSF